MDDAPALAGRDPGGMLQQVAGFPAQLARAREVQAAFRAAHPGLAAQSSAGEPAREVLVCGMGGSAIGGEFAAAWAASCGVRVEVHRGYGLPTWVEARHLLVFSSYSGDTEETLSAYEASAGCRARRVCVTTAGRLAELARRDGLPCLELPAGLQPRAALGHSLVALLVLLHESGLVRRDPVAEIDAAARHLRKLGETLAPEVPESDNRAKQLARSCHGRLPFFCTGTGITRPVGTRWKGQLNENAKALAVASVLPEMNHNEIMAWRAIPEVRRLARLFFLRDRDDPPALLRRMQVTSEILAERVAGVDWLDTAGTGLLERMLGASYLGDYASVYLAFLNDVDPTPVQQIDVLKQRL
ncbi:MAG: bifunctional phosphoglucose/phosphomannose isomerase, partial [Candidatus Krumholzibacteriia bacterium]